MTKEVDVVRVWFRFLRLETKIRLAIAGKLKALGLSVPQCDVLTTLTEQEGVSQQELAERLYVTKGNISGLIDRLVLAGLVERRSIKGDRRSHAIFLTEAGRSIAIQGIAVQREFVLDTLGRLPEDDLKHFEAQLYTIRNLMQDKVIRDGVTSDAESADQSPVAVSS